MRKTIIFKFFFILPSLLSVPTTELNVAFVYLELKGYCLRFFCHDPFPSSSCVRCTRALVHIVGSFTRSFSRLAPEITAPAAVIYRTDLWNLQAIPRKRGIFPASLRVPAAKLQPRCRVCALFTRCDARVSHSATRLFLLTDAQLHLLIKTSIFQKREKKLSVRNVCNSDDESLV